MGKKGDFKCGVGIATRQFGLNISETADPAQPSLGFIQNNLKKRKMAH